tara:strand:+ start:659 stop:967 length:309 start_codon:yes stop_codon:yes gene_type:complete
MEIKGIIQSIGDVVNFKDSFNKQSIIVKTNEEYSQIFEVQFIKEKISYLDDVKVGDNITVNVNVNGREWENPDTGIMKYFVSLNAWKLEVNEPSKVEDNLPF